MIGDLKLAEAVAAAMRESVPAGHAPVNLHAIARTLGVAQICLTELATDGMTTWDDGLATIVLSSDVSKLRRRFTLAHELGHVMLGHGGVRHRGDTHQVSEKVEHEERLCDQIAAALLMPRASVEELVANELSLTSFLAFAAASEVSPSALAWRVAEVSGKTALLMDLDQGEAGWYIVRTNGRQPWRSQQATVVATSFGVFGDLARTPRDAAMRLALPSYEVDVFGEAVASFVRGRWQARMLVTAVHRVPPPVIARRP